MVGADQHPLPGLIKFLVIHGNVVFLGITWCIDAVMLLDGLLIMLIMIEQYNKSTFFSSSIQMASLTRLRFPGSMN